MGVPAAIATLGGLASLQDARPRCWGTTGLHDSPLEGNGFETSVPRIRNHGLQSAPRLCNASDGRGRGVAKMVFRAEDSIGAGRKNKITEFPWVERGNPTRW